MRLREKAIESPESKKATAKTILEEQTHVEKIIARVAATLEHRGEDPFFVAEALAFIDQRSHDAGTVPGSERYFLVAYKTLLATRDELAVVTDLVIRKKHLRDKYMPDPIVPNEKDAEKIILVRRAVEDAAPAGRRTTDVMAERFPGPSIAKARSDLAAFERFYDSYPNKVAKPLALQEWVKSVTATDSPKAILDGLERWKRSVEWVEPQFIPNPAKFILGRQWEDTPMSQVQELRENEIEKQKTQFEALKARNSGNRS